MQATALQNSSPAWRVSTPGRSPRMKPGVGQWGSASLVCPVSPEKLFRSRSRQFFAIQAQQSFCSDPTQTNSGAPDGACVQPSARVIPEVWQTVPARSGVGHHRLRGGGEVQAVGRLHVVSGAPRAGIGQRRAEAAEKLEARVGGRGRINHDAHTVAVEAAVPDGMVDAAVGGRGAE